jgi:SAM-dependent methyltransferase
MTSSFNEYSKYYDLLYSDKNYYNEFQYVSDLINKYCITSPQSLLELGCGTGVHASLLSSKISKIVGIDLSEGMVKLASERCAKYRLERDISFEVGDIRNYNSSRVYDVVISLFHVFSYQVSNEDVCAMLLTAYNHLPVGGIFIFDFWYGPSVLSQKPISRIKRLKNEHLSVTRIAEPVIHDDENYVDVFYEVFVENMKTNLINKFDEKHSMRYFFMNEMQAYLSRFNFSICVAEELVTKSVPSLDTWGVCIVARKNEPIV